MNRRREPQYDPSMAIALDLAMVAVAVIAGIVGGLVALI